MANVAERIAGVRKLIPNFENTFAELVKSAEGKLLEVNDRSVLLVIQSMGPAVIKVWDVPSDNLLDNVNRLDVVLAHIWERLNSGHWKLIPHAWRFLYSFVSLLKIIFMLHTRDITDSEVIKVCDFALLLGAPILDHIFSKIAFSLHLLKPCEAPKEHSSDSVPIEQIPENDQWKVVACDASILKNQYPNRFKVNTITKPSIEAFVQDHFLPQVPALLNDTIDHWPARKKWNIDYIKKSTGLRTVPVEIGAKYTSEEWTQKLMRMQDFIDDYVLTVREGKQGYLAQHQLFLQIPELMEDIRIPEYCLVGDEQDVEINAWFGPAGTVSPVHYDPKHNLLTQVFGKKIIRLFPTSEWKNLYPHDPESLLFNTSQVDIEDPELHIKFPHIATAAYADILLEPGMTLYMPPKWAHFVKSLSPSFSVSFWFH